MTGQAEHDRKDADIAPPAHVRPYVRALGPDLACRFLLSFGGSVVYLTPRPQERSMVREVLTKEQIRALADATDGGWLRVPTAKPFIAAHLRASGMSVAEIARTLHVADWSVRRWTNGDRAAVRTSQRSLFD